MKKFKCKIKVLSTPYSRVYLITPKQILTLVTHKTCSVLGMVLLTTWLTSSSSVLQKASKHFVMQSFNSSKTFRMLMKVKSSLLFLFCLKGEGRKYIIKTLSHCPEVAQWPKRRGRSIFLSEREKIWDTSLRSEILASCIIGQCMLRGM